MYVTICAKIGNIRTISKYTNAKGLSRKKYVVHIDSSCCVICDQSTIPANCMHFSVTA